MITFSAAFCETVSELKDSIRTEERQLRRLKEGVLLTQVKSGKKLSYFYGYPGRLLLYFLLFPRHRVKHPQQYKRSLVKLLNHDGTTGVNDPIEPRMTSILVTDTPVPLILKSLLSPYFFRIF